MRAVGAWTIAVAVSGGLALVACEADRAPEHAASREAASASARRDPSASPHEARDLPPLEPSPLSLELTPADEALLLALGASEATTPAVATWRAPSCPARYALRVVTVETSEEARVPPSTITLDADLEMRPRGDVPRAFALHAIEVRLRVDDRPPMRSPEGTLADVLLRIEDDGRAVREDDGPTALWSAYGTWPGLVTMMPDLPAATETGAEGAWPLVLHDRASGFAVEVRRGRAQVPAGRAMPPVRPSAHATRTVLVRSFSVGERPGAIVRAAWSDRGAATLEGAPGMVGRSSALMRWTHQAIIVDGQLVHGAVHADIERSMRIQGGAVGLAMRVRVDAELRRVASCDGPVLPAFAAAALPSADPALPFVAPAGSL